MEASRAFYGSLKKYDPFRELWRTLVDKSSSESSLARLSKDEQKYFAVSILEGEVYNGGFDQFFSNSSGDYYQLALDGLEDLDASFSIASLRRPPLQSLAAFNLPLTDQSAGELWIQGRVGSRKS